MKRGKKGLSTVIAVLLMVGLTLALISIVGIAVKSLIENKISESEACFGVFDKVTLNDEYTCYITESERFLFSINIGDVDVDEVLISVLNESDSSFPIAIDNEEKPVDFVGLESSDLGGGNEVSLPEKNGGKTYASVPGINKPKSIKIAPKIKGVQCEVTDEVPEIKECLPRIKEEIILDISG